MRVFTFTNIRNDVASILKLQLLSANNIATYGALCGLASFDRQELQKLVIGSRCVSNMSVF